MLQSCFEHCQEAAAKAAGCLPSASNQSISQPVSGSVSQSINQPGQSVKQSPTTTVIQSNAPRNATSLCGSLTPTRTVCHSAGNSFNLIQPFCHVTIVIHSPTITQHVTFTPFSGFLSLMPLSLAWLWTPTHTFCALIVPSNPVLSHGCYLTPLSISHTLTPTLMLKQKCLLSPSSSLPRTPAVAPDQSHRSPRFIDKTRGRTCGPQR